MSKNTGEQYETLVREIYQQFANYESECEGFNKIEVQHNVLLPGISGVNHQVDVYWEFEFVGTVYKTIVEVKDWSKPVKMEQLMSFHSVLKDISGLPKGIFVSRSGFQSGALTYAKTHGIQLVEITKENPCFKLNISIKETTTYYDNIYLEINDSLFEEQPHLLKELEEKFSETVYTNVSLVNRDKQIFSLSKMMYENARPYYFEEDDKRTKIAKDLDGDWFCLTGDGRFPAVRISGYGFECYNRSAFCSQDMTLLNFADYIITSHLDGKKHGYSTQRKQIVKLQTDDNCH